MATQVKWAVLGIILWTLPGWLHAESGTGPLDPQMLPPRQEESPSGTEFVRTIQPLSIADREDVIFAAVMSGNVPDHLRVWIPVQLSHITSQGHVLNASVFVLPDYLSIGSNEDYVRIPVSFNLARRLAAKLNLMLPTRKIVDAVYQQADTRFRPQPMRAGPEMCTTDAFAQHNARINHQRPAQDQDQGLMSGHKKDLIISSKLALYPGQLAIYGWHRADGQPIQPPSLAHEADYVDYSHGVRFVHPLVMVNGKLLSIYEVLERRDLAPVLSSEGAIPGLRQIMQLRHSSSPNI